MTFLGRPTSLKTCSQSVLATPCDKISILMGIYLVIFEKQFTTTSTPLDPVKGVMTPLDVCRWFPRGRKELYWGEVELVSING